MSVRGLNFFRSVLYMMVHDWSDSDLDGSDTDCLVKNVVDEHIRKKKTGINHCHSLRRVNISGWLMTDINLTPKFRDMHDNARSAKIDRSQNFGWNIINVTQGWHIMGGVCRMWLTNRTGYNHNSVCDTNEERYFLGSGNIKSGINYGRIF